MENSLFGKRLLVLGGSAWISIIKDFAKRNGIVLIGCGNNPSSSLALLDEYYNVNSTDHIAMKHLIIDKKIDGVYIGSNETVIKEAIEYLHELDMPCYCNSNQWELLQNKGSFKELCKEFGLPVAERFNYTLKSPCEVTFPVVTKPVDGCASLGITICNNYEELIAGYVLAEQNSTKKEVIVEQCVNNNGMDVFYQITNGEIDFCLLGDKYPVQLEKNAGSVAGARILPSNNTKQFKILFDEKIKKMFKSIGLYQGLIWFEVFYDGKDYFFNEVGYRPNGSLSIVGIDYLCGINTVAADMNYALTGVGKKGGFPSLILKKHNKNKNHVCEYWIAARDGIVGRIEGIEKILNIENVLAVFPKYKIGDKIPHTKGFAQNFCVIHFAFDNECELNKTVDIINGLIVLNDINGNDMIIKKEQSFIDKIHIAKEK